MNQKSKSENLGRRIVFLVFFIYTATLADTIQLRWTFQPDKTVDFTVGERESVVTLKPGQGINFDKLIVDSNTTDFIVDLVTDSVGKRFYLKAPDNTKSAFIDLGEYEAHTIPMAPESGYSPQPLALQIGHTYCLMTADGYHYARLFVVKQQLETPQAGQIVTADQWVPVKLTYTIPVPEDKLELYELPYLDEEIIVNGEINLQSLEVVEQLTHKKERIDMSQITQIEHYPLIMRDSFVWWNRGKVLKYQRMKRRFSRVDQEESFVDLHLGDGRLVTAYPPDSSAILFRSGGRIDSLFFIGFFWMEEIGKSKYHHLWQRTYQERKEKKFIRRIER